MNYVKIKNLGEIVTGNTPSKKIEDFYKSKDIPFIKPDGLNEYRISDLIYAKEYISNEAEKKARVLNRGSVLITCIGIIGKIGIIACDKMAFNQQINAIVPNKDTIDVKYLSYILMHNKENLQAIANAAVVPIINKTQFGEYKLYIHEDIQRQKKIVKALDKAQELIDKRKEQIAACDELIKSKFIEMFGSPMKNPYNWDVVKLSNLCRDIVDCPHSTPKHEEERTEYPSIRTTELKNGYIDWTSMKYVGEDEYQARTKKIVPKYNDIVYGREGSYGEAVLLPRGYNFCLGQRVVLLRADAAKCYAEFLWYSIRSEYVYYQAKTKNIGATVGHVNVGDIKKFWIMLPPINQQKEFVELVKRVDKLKSQLQQSLTELENNFNSLMQRAFKGELF